MVVVDCIARLLECTQSVPKITLFFSHRIDPVHSGA